MHFFVIFIFILKSKNLSMMFDSSVVDVFRVYIRPQLTLVYVSSRYCWSGGRTGSR